VKRNAALSTEHCGAHFEVRGAKPPHRRTRRGCAAAGASLANDSSSRKRHGRAAGIAGDYCSALAGLCRAAGALLPCGVANNGAGRRRASAAVDLPPPRMVAGLGGNGYARYAPAPTGPPGARDAGFWLRSRWPPHRAAAGCIQAWALRTATTGSRRDHCATLLLPTACLYNARCCTLNIYRNWRDATAHHLLFSSRLTKRSGHRGAWRGRQLSAGSST